MFLLFHIWLLNINDYICTQGKILIAIAKLVAIHLFFSSRYVQFPTYLIIVKFLSFLTFHFLNSETLPKNKQLTENFLFTCFRFVTSCENILQNRSHQNLVITSLVYLKQGSNSFIKYSLKCSGQYTISSETRQKFYHIL